MRNKVLSILFLFIAIALALLYTRASGAEYDEISYLPVAMKIPLPDIFQFWGNCSEADVEPCEEAVIQPIHQVTAEEGYGLYAIWAYFMDPMYGDSAVVFPATGCVRDSYGLPLWCGDFKGDVFIFSNLTEQPFYLIAAHERPYYIHKDAEAIPQLLRVGDKNLP